jgi:hypothetical protein
MIYFGTAQRANPCGGGLSNRAGIADSIRRFGFINPVLVDDTGQIDESGIDSNDRAAEINQRSAIISR